MFPSNALRSRSALRPSQQKAHGLIMDNEAMMLCLPMGAGKSGTMLTAIRDLLDQFEVTKVLVVAPLLVAENTWPEEIELWEHTHVLDYEVLTGPEERRAQRARRLPEVSIINVENVNWLVDFWGDNWPYDMLVIDEMSRFKNPSKKTKPTKTAVQKVIDTAMKALPRGMSPEETEKAVQKEVKKLKGNLTRFGSLCKVRQHFVRVYGMTGTPAPNGLLDIWSQYYLLDQGFRLGNTFNAYRTRWFESDYMGYNYALRPYSFDQIIERIKDITISMESDATLPPVVYNKVKVKLPEKVMKQYRKFEKTLLLEEHDIEAVNNGVLTGKLLQLANGSVYDEDRDVIEIHSLKLEALDSMIQDANGAPVLVAYNFQFDLAKLKKKYPHAEVVGEAEDFQKRWNAGKIPLLLIHPQSGGHGLNLQYGGCLLVWYGLTWSLECYQQLNKRLHRPGQKETVFIQHIIAEGTVDERVMEVLPQKEATQDMLIAATRL